jgi:SSS family solute:Na+ symporter
LNSSVGLNTLDLAIFAVYLALSMLIGFWAGRHGRRNAKEYFLGDKGLPWYVVGTSMVAAVISSDHFIAQVGAGYSQGIVIAAFGWNAWIVYTLLIWIFLPYYMRTGLYTMPEFLERRYNPACRYIFAGFLMLGYVASLIAGPLFAGGVALESMLGLNIYWGIVALGMLTGAYTIYGGLRAAAWTDFMQMAVLLAGGILVPVLGLMKVGGLFSLVHDLPGKFQVFHSARHELFPFTGVFTSFLSVGIWYNCTSQHLVQRCLAAKNEWHARVGVVSAGFLHVVLPALFVLPGIIAYKMFPHLERPDSAYLMLIQSLIPAGIRGLILAAMAAALMSHISSMLNSTSTILAIDLYQKLWKRAAAQKELVRAGQWSGLAVLASSIGIALYFSTLKSSFLFVLIQNVFAYIAPPFAVIFTLGILWRRATAAAALLTIGLGFPFTLLLQYVLFERVPWLQPYGNYLHRALFSWAFCMIVMVASSLATAPPDAEKIKDIIWSPRYTLLPQKLQAMYGGWKDFRVWWLIFVTVVLSIYGFFLWFRFQHAENP